MTIMIEPLLPSGGHGVSCPYPEGLSDGVNDGEGLTHYSGHIVPRTVAGCEIESCENASALCACGLLSPLYRLRNSPGLAARVVRATYGVGATIGARRLVKPVRVAATGPSSRPMARPPASG